MAVRLFVGNLPYSATEAEIRELFTGVGPVASVRLPLDRETGRPRGFAFVEFTDRAIAEEAIRRFHNQLIGGRPISVNEARPQERGSGPPPGGGGFGGGGGYGGGGGGGGGYAGGGGGGYGGPRPGGPGGGFGGPRPGGPPGGGGGFGGPRPGGPPGGGFGGPRPGGGFGGGFEVGDSSGDAGDRDRRRNFGPDALPKRARKGKGGKGERDRVPKGPLSAKGGGRIFYADDDEEQNPDLIDNIDETADLDDFDNLGESYEGEEGAEPESKSPDGASEDDDHEDDDLEGDDHDDDDDEDDEPTPGRRRRK